MAEFLPDHIPEDVESERSLLATLCAPGAERAAYLFCPQLVQEDFCDPRHRAIFIALRDVIADKQEITPFSIKAHLESAKKFVQVGEFSGLTEILHGEEVLHPEVLVRILQSKRRLRELIRLGSKLTESALHETDDPENLVARAQDTLHHISQDGRLAESESWTEILDDMAHGEAFRTGKTDRGGFWGVPSLDEQCPIPSGEYVTIGARPGVGKTAFLGQIAIASAMKGFTPLIIQAELPKMTQRGRLASYFTGLPMSRLKQGMYDTSHVERLAGYREALARGRTLPLSAGTPWGKIEAMIRYEIDRHGVDLVLLDQFDKIGRDQIVKGSSEAYAFGKVSIGVMALAQETSIGMVVLAQLVRDADEREPLLSDFADTDRLGKDPGVAVGLFRTKQDETRIKILKNRDGAFTNHVISLGFDGRRFDEPTPGATTTSQEQHSAQGRFAGICDG